MESLYRLLYQYPGATVLVMTLWWLLPVFTVKIVMHPFLKYMPSHLPYVLTLFFSFISAITVNIIDSSSNIWMNATNWGRYHILCTAYTVQMILTFLAIRLLDACRMIGFYDGGPEGSVETLFVPVALLYFFMGISVRWGITIKEWNRKRKERVEKSKIVINDNNKDKMHGEEGSIHIIFLIKFALLMVGALIVYKSWQAGTLEEDMTRYANEIINAVKYFWDQQGSRSDGMFPR
jgi:hypothetical protein